MALLIPKNPQLAKEEAAAKARAAAAEARTKSTSTAPIMKYINPEDCLERIRLLADDSGSMCGQFEDAKKGIVEFLRNCIPNQTSAAVHFLNGLPVEEGESNAFNALASLHSDLLTLATLVENAPFDSGGTPLFGSLGRVLDTLPRCTRMAVFTDGSPTDCLKASERRDYTTFDKASADIICDKAISYKIPIDTVFFGADYNKSEIALLKYIAERTGGYFLHFDPNKVNFATAFKYLAPVNRMMLASESVRREIESGQRA